MSAAALAYPTARISDCAICGHRALLADGFAVCEHCLTPERLESYRQHAIDAADADVENADRYLAAEDCRWCPKRMDARAESGRRLQPCTHHTHGRN